MEQQELLGNMVRVGFVDGVQEDCKTGQIRCS